MAGQEGTPSEANAGAARRPAERTRRDAGVNGARADDPVADIRRLASATGHPTDNARLALARLERAVAAGALPPTETLQRAMSDLRLVLTQDEGQRLGGKSGEAARMILRAIVRELD